MRIQNPKSKIQNVSCRGQIATLLLLVVVVVLVLAMAAANLGVSASMSARMSNAADAAALHLGSELATVSHRHWIALEEQTEICATTGILFYILAALAALAVMYFSGDPYSAVTIASAIVAAAGVGAGGAALTGQDPAVGALQGAAVGAAVVGGYMAFAQIGAGAGIAGSEGATFATSLEVAAGFETLGMAGAEIPVTVGAFQPIPAGLAGVAPTTGSVIAPSTLGAAGAGLAAGSASLNKAQADAQLTQTLAAAEVALRGLDTRDRILQGAMLEAFRRTVDNPKTEKDFDDADNDGIKEQEELPAFAVWWHTQIQQLKAHAEQRANGIKAVIAIFFDSLRAFLRSADTFVTAQLSRQEVEGTDGKVVHLARLLEIPAARTNTTNTTDDYPVDFWTQGRHESPEMAGYDDVDAVITKLKDFKLFAEGNEDMNGLLDFKLHELADSTALPTWVWAVESEQQTFAAMINGQGEDFSGLKGWQAELASIRDTQLPPCNISDTSGVVIDNSPCSILQPRKDEFNRELANIDAFLAMINAGNHPISGTTLYNDIVAQIQAAQAGKDQLVITSIKITSLALAAGVITYQYNYTFYYCGDGTCNATETGCAGSCPTSGGGDCACCTSADCPDTADSCTQWTPRPSNDRLCERTCTFHTAPICNDRQWCSGNQPTTIPGVLDCGAEQRCENGGTCVPR